MDAFLTFGVSLVFIFLSLRTTNQSSGSDALWSRWWTYTGQAGPRFWGNLSPDWSLCATGKYQSPIDIKPRALLFDPSLRRLTIEIPITIHGTLVNTGRDVTLVVDESSYSSLNISDGPLMYHYRVAQIKLHFGSEDDHGSEHTIEGTPFSAEIQLVAYNTDIYSSFREALQAPYGIAIVSVFAEIGQPVNEAFKTMATFAQRILWKGQSTRVETIPAKALFPNTNYYVTYEGSLTQPGCYETVTWVIFNKPIYISKDMLTSLRRLQQGINDDPSNTVANNNRPIMPINNRVIRTNINHPGTSTSNICGMTRYTFYQINPSLDV
ncbi:carbonic anhydrase-related protein 10-like isoform X1 [Haliotis cracherodii]|uniref:carbonic anhydrase-related protein 10-like isoform X1 n=1 Tax=Haliotis cracherodii TaxID=6455 RepID=UPI0039E8C767